MSLLKTQSDIKILTVRLALEHKNKMKVAHQKSIRNEKKNGNKN